MIKILPLLALALACSFVHAEPATIEAVDNPFDDVKTVQPVLTRKVEPPAPKPVKPAKVKATPEAAPEGASAKCRDGTYSFSQTRRGTCSHHGGVAVWLN